MTSDLITRLSKLDAPDREVDAEIVFDLLATPVGQHKEDGGPIGYIDLADQPSWNLGMRFPGKDKAWFAATRKQIKGETLLIERDNAYVLMNSIRVPELTGSWDAVKFLMDRLFPGTEYEFTNLYNIVRVTIEMNGEYGGFHGEHVNSLPIAICIALLRAKEAPNAQ